MDTSTSSSAPTATELAYGLAGLEQPAASADDEARVPSTAVGAVRWLTDVKRVESHPLAFPFAIGDVEYRTITVKRLSAGEVAAFVAKLSAMPEGAPAARYPMFFLGDAEISDEAWDAMDDDDRFALAEISEGFLPERFRR